MAGTPQAFILVGGRSRRMGTDKALLQVGEEPLVTHIMRVVEEIGIPITLVGDPERYAFLNRPVVPDLYPGMGPVGGILTALNCTTAKWNLILACDMPCLSPDICKSLIQHARKTQTECVIPTTPDGREHPLCAVYARSAFHPLDEVFQAGKHRLLTAVRALKVEHFVAKDADWSENINTPSEWAAFLEKRINATR